MLASVGLPYATTQLAIGNGFSAIIACQTYIQSRLTHSRTREPSERKKEALKSSGLVSGEFLPADACNLFSSVVSSTRGEVSYVSAPTFFENRYGFPESQLVLGGLGTLGMRHHSLQARPYRWQPIRCLSFYSEKVIMSLEALANEKPDNAEIQAEYLNTVVEEDPEYVIRRYESGKYASNSDCHFVYIKAKKSFEEGNSSRRKQRQRSFPWSGSKRKQFDTEASSSVGVGSESNPVHVIRQPNKGSFFKEQFWTTLRFLIGLVLVLSLIEGQLQMRMTSNQKPILPDMSEKKVRFEDVQGVDEAKEELKEIVEFLRSPEKFTKLGGKLPKGILLIGSPGTGKTLLARAVAGEAGVPFFFCSGSEFDEMFVGVGAARVRNLFHAAKENSPCIVFVDELDAIGGTRVASDHQPYSRMTLNQLLVELDGFEENSGVVVIAATNFPEILDKALLRPGRFDSKISIVMPDVRARHQILIVHTKQVPLAKDVNLEIVARGTPGFSGADIANLINQAAIHSSTKGSLEVTMESLEWAKDKIIMGPERKSAVIEEQNRKMVAYHEAGHALVAMLTPGAMPVHKATIMPRGQALGMVSQLPEKDELSWSKKQLLARIDVSMGGRAAEELVFGEENITSGAVSDFEQATTIAENMVLRFGMSEKVGHVLHKDLGKASPEMQNLLNLEIKRFLEESYQRAIGILKKHQTQHRRLAEALLHYETLSSDEIKRIVDGKSLQRKL
eukprot:m.29881 g.29881  ORF g.29881 m.29881 type:complete len:732 (+) comp31246_c0_seq3:1391-3586(+)